MDLAALRLLHTGAESFVHTKQVTQQGCAKLLAPRYRAKSVSSKELMFSSERESLNRFAEN